MVESAPGQLTRQQIYDRIRQSSRDEYILEEMILLGFWPKEQDSPSVPAAVIKRQGNLERELRELLDRRRLMENPERALKEMRKQRMAESRRRRKENKIKRIKAAHSKAVAWHHRRKKEILFLGRNYSKGLNRAVNRSETLAQQNLPDLPDALSLAAAMGISLSELRFLSYTRPVSTVNHYQRFEIAKKTGGTRLISAPMPRMKRAQYWILENILAKIQLPDAAHGFVPSRSILTNAKPHIGAKVVINLDLKDFFPTITYPRIKGLLFSLGYSEQVATILALLCSEPEMDHVQLDGKAYFVSHGARFLPQGAPTSPAISNILCCRLDCRLAAMAAKLGFTYTRYADDLTYSSTTDVDGHLPKLLWRTRQIVNAEGFAINDAKTRVMHSGRRQEVTGIVVNRKLSIQRKTLKRFRALLFQLEKDGPKGKAWGRGGDIFEAILGYANFIKMVDPAKGQKYLYRVKHILKKYKYNASQSTIQPLSKYQFRRKAAAGELPRDDWWQIQEKPVPELTLPQVAAHRIKPKVEPSARESSTRAESPVQGPSTRGTSAPRPWHKKPLNSCLVQAAAVLCILLGVIFIVLYFILRLR
jgi:retron-type reverse transcriptase